MVPDRHILAMASSYSDQQEIATALVEAANVNGGSDNMTVVVGVQREDGKEALSL
ncbi:MAG: hypothetical protein M1548_01280 [Actinobacteria bacterium]|nr:hypothetical protein [Actinomycetota bacterium]